MICGGVTHLASIVLSLRSVAPQTSICSPRSCYDLQYYNLTQSTKATIWLPDLSGLSPLEVRCDFATDGGGWTLFQRRRDGSVDFEQSWTRYKTGFGNDREFWLGNEHIHRLTNERAMSLRIDMARINGMRHHVVYDHFRVRNESSGYTLSVGPIRVDTTYVGDMLRYHRDIPFTTYDRDNSRGACAIMFRGGWWYNDCVRANLNGLWRARVNSTVLDDNLGMMWMPYDPEPRLKTCSMMVRPLSVNKTASDCRRPCPNGGTCQGVNTGRYRCACASGYTGATCQKAVPCYKTTCKNGGTPLADDDICNCRCVTGFDGEFCQFKEHSIRPPATHVPPAATKSGVTPAPVDPPSGINEDLIFDIAILCVGIAVGLLAVCFLWSLVGSIRLRKKNKLLTIKEKKPAVETKHSRVTKLSNCAKAVPSPIEDVVSTGSSIASSGETSV